MLGGVADQALDQLDGAGEVFVHRDLPAPVVAAGGFAIVVVDVDQVDVARHVQLARAELAHADHPQLGALARLGQRRAVAFVELGEGVGAGGVERQFGQLGDGAGHHGQRRGLLAVQHHQPFHHQLAQDAQARAQFVVAAFGQRGQAGRHAVLGGRAGRQQGQFVLVAAAQALHQARMAGAARQAGERG